MLASLLGKQRLIVAGINSGTSADGLDMVALEIERQSGRFKGWRFLDATSMSYPSTVRTLILALADAPQPALDRVMRADEFLGRYVGKAAVRFINRLRKKGLLVDFIASHGQTIRHLPARTKLLTERVNATLQIGSPEQIAAITSLPVVADFRKGDLAVGGEGAPITVAAVTRLFHKATESRLLVNIGGMSNYFYLGKGTGWQNIRAGDCGPGNVLSDLATQRLYDKPYDRRGNIALAGTVSEVLMRILFKFAKQNKFGVSTGRETFGKLLTEKIVAEAKALHITNAIVIASLAQFTVESIVRTVLPFLKRDRNIGKLYLTGGGSHNRFFVERLTERLAPVPVANIEELGLASGHVEAASYAIMGESCIRGEALPTRFGGRVQTKMPVNGRIVQPPVESK